MMLVVLGLGGKRDTEEHFLVELAEDTDRTLELIVLAISFKPDIDTDAAVPDFLGAELRNIYLLMNQLLLRSPDIELFLVHMVG